MVFRRHHIALGALLVAALALPLVGDSYQVRIATRIVAFAIVAVGVDLVVGYAGLITFGHAAFLGVGAYLTAILAQNGILAAVVVLPLVAMAGALVAALIGAISLRAQGIYFIFITLAFAQMLYHLAQSL